MSSESLDVEVDAQEQAGAALPGAFQDVRLRSRP